VTARPGRLFLAERRESFVDRSAEFLQSFRTGHEVTDDAAEGSGIGKIDVRKFINNRSDEVSGDGCKCVTIEEAEGTQPMAAKANRQRHFKR
jgi:hypothetical protein